MDAGSQALPTGARIGKYEITQVLGIGGFGVTYKAWDHRLEWNVAIKEYLPVEYAFRDRDTAEIEPRSHSTAQQFEYGLNRFLEEARTLAKFKDPNIVRVVDHIEASGTAYLVMDYEEGETLAKRLQREGALSESALLALILPILNGLRTVHSVGILHRDIKPGNIYLRRNGSPVLIDFGSAKQDLGEHTCSVTTMVTAGYAPFEQYSNRSKQGPYTDLYALGATMHRCINGNGALPQSSERVIAANDNGQDPLVSATKIGAGRYNQNLLEAVDWLLQIHPKDRPQTVDELLEKIAPEQASPEGTKLLGSTPTVPGLSLEAEVEVCSEPTMPIMEIEANDLPVRHRHQRAQGSRRRKITDISLGVLAIAAAAVGVGIWQQWIDMELQGIDLGKIVSAVISPQTVAIKPAPTERPAPEETPEPTTAPQQADDVAAVLAESTITNAGDLIPAVSEEEIPTEPAVASVAAAPVPEPGDSIEPAQISPESVQDSQPAIDHAAIAPADTTTEAVATVAVVKSDKAVSTKKPLSEQAATPVRQENMAAQNLPVEPAPSAEPSEDPTVVAERKRQQEIADLLAKGKSLQITGKLTRPENDNALATYLGVINLDPGNAQATQALSKIGARLQAIAKDKLNDQQFKTAERYIDLALKIQGDNTTWLALKEQIATERQQYYSHQKRLDQLFQQATELEAKGITLEDNGENTADIYLKVLEIDSGNPKAKNGLFDALLIYQKMIQSNPSSDGYQRLTHYALTAVEKAPKDQAINNFYSDVQRELELWEEQQNAPKITRIITANSEPNSITQAQNNFDLSIARIYVAFDFQNFESGSVVRAVLFDGARKIKLMQVPVVIKSAQGSHVFYLNKPIDGFQIGSYRVEMMLGKEHVASAEFIIDD